jgi:hypothetical protein
VVDNPYVGPRPFERDDASRFFGRTREARDLASLVVAHRVVLVYSPSGAGKSSLVNAGVTPLVESKGCSVMSTVRVGALTDESAENVFVAAVTTQMGGDSGSIASALQVQPQPVDEEGDPAPRVLILDQFEELFTSHPEYWSHRAGLFDGLRTALTAEEGLRVLLVMREEYLAQLEPYAPMFPARLKVRFRLDRLDREEALAAVTLPLHGSGRSFAPGVAESLVDDLLRLRIDTGAGDVVDVTGEFVEPVQLQVVCSRLWTELPAGVTEIRAEHASELADLDAVLGRFYDEALARACAASSLPEHALRRWVRDELITPGGTRSTVYRGRDETAGLPNAALDALEANRLVRAEQRAGALWYELTHDRLIAPIKRSNEAFAQVASRRRRWRLLVAAGVLGAAALAAVVTFLASLGGEAPGVGALPSGCRSCSGRFGALAVEPSVSYREYLQRRALPTAGLASALLGRTGVLVGFTLRLHGRDMRFPVGWELDDANTGASIAEEQVLVVVPQAADDVGRQSVWVPRPAANGLFQITLKLFRPGAPASGPLDTATTPTFAGGNSAGSQLTVTVRVVRTGNGEGRVVGPEVDCGAVCVAQYPYGAVVRVTATPAPGSSFVGWGGICPVGKTVCRFPVGPITSLRARFDKTTR